VLTWRTKPILGDQSLQLSEAPKTLYISTQMSRLSYYTQS